MPAKWKTGIFLTNIVEKNKTKNAKRKSFINEGGNMGKLKVLVAESQTVVKQHLTKELEKDLEIAVVGATDNGKDAFEIFKREEPNIVIFDLLLPIYDGYTLLDKINEYGVSDKTKLIMTTTVTSDLLICEAFHRNVDYVLTKPYDTKIVVKKVKKIYTRMNEIIEEGTVATTEIMTKENTKGLSYSVFEDNKKIDKAISEKLNAVGIPTRLKGYRYMITAVKEAINNEEALDAVTKILYPDVAKKHHSTAQRVEKAIRHAIEVAWNDQAHKENYGYIIDSGKYWPTNSEFIAKITQDIIQNQ